MNEIRQWTLTVSAVSIMSGILNCLLPKSMQKNIFKVVAGIVIIYAFLEPLTGVNRLDFKVNDFLKDNYQVSENIDKYAVNSMINSAEKAIEDLLFEKAEENNIDCKFECKCILTENQIIVSQITVSPRLSQNEKTLIESWSESYGFDKSIIIFEGEDSE